jgi:site-specific DNA recombinase
MNLTSRRAAIYARVSTDKQNPLSPADQERKCREYADRNGIAVVSGHVYCDECLSGVGLDRPALQRLLRTALALTRDFDVILVDDTSRLSRSTEDVLSIYRDLNFAEEWHYVAEGTWNLLGTGPNAPVLGLAHSDGCGGLQCTEPASLVLPFRFELVQVAA